jgi:hypothetical protein
MGDIVCLPERIARPAKRTAAELPASGAQILLFTGIRYERMTEAQAQPDPKKPHGRRRA